MRARAVAVARCWLTSARTVHMPAADFCARSAHGDAEWENAAAAAALPHVRAAWRALSFALAHAHAPQTGPRRSCLLCTLSRFGDGSRERGLSGPQLRLQSLTRTRTSRLGMRRQNWHKRRGRTPSCGRRRAWHCLRSVWPLSPPPPLRAHACRPSGTPHPARATLPPRRTPPDDAPLPCASCGSAQHSVYRPLIMMIELAMYSLQL